MSRSFVITVNGARRTVEVEPDTPLLWVLRDQLGLNGAKYGCGVGVCGACTVQVDGEAARSCVVPISEIGGAAITTIEGLGEAGRLHKVQLAWIEAQVPQCGYCQTGMIMAVAARLNESPRPSADDIVDSLSNICRCGTYVRMRKAIARASESAGD